MLKTILLLLLALLTLASPSVLAKTQSIVVATGEYKPYTSAEMPGYGAFTEVVTAVFAEMGISPAYQFFPWKRAEKAVEAGEVYASMPYYKTPEREKDFDFSDTVWATKQKVIYIPKNLHQTITYNALEDLKPYRIGGVLGYWYEKRLKEAGLNVEYVSSDEINLKKLAAGRVNLVIMDELVARLIIKKEFPDRANDFVAVDKAVLEAPLFLMVSRKYPGSAAITENFDKALRLIKKKGIYQQILGRYGLTE